MFDEIDENGSKPGLTWRSRLKDIDNGSFIAILGPKNSEYRGIVAVGEALGPVSFRAGRDENIVKWRHDVFLRRVSLPIEIVMEIADCKQYYLLKLQILKLLSFSYFLSY